MNFEVAEEIRDVHRTKNITYEKLAEQFNTSGETVSRIIKDKLWTDSRTEEKKLKDYFEETRQRVKSHVDIIEDEDDSKKHHWIWNALYHGPYGQSKFKGQSMAAHVVSYLAFNEILPEEIDWECIRHQCIFKGCVNNSCLLSGSHKENMADMIFTGNSNRGEKHVRCKITEDTARQIKQSKGQGT